MADTNYVISMVTILEKPVQKVLNEKISVTKFRAQLPQTKTTKIVNLIFWGNLGYDIANYYKINDYIMIEGYLSFGIKRQNNLILSSKQIYITIIKIYPLKIDYSVTK